MGSHRSLHEEQLADLWPCCRRASQRPAAVIGQIGITVQAPALTAACAAVQLLAQWSHSSLLFSRRCCFAADPVCATSRRVGRDLFLEDQRLPAPATPAQPKPESLRAAYEQAIWRVGLVPADR